MTKANDNVNSIINKIIDFNFLVRHSIDELQLEVKNFMCEY